MKKTETLPLFTARDALLVAAALSVSVFLFVPLPFGIPSHVFGLTWSSIFLEAMCFMLIGSVVSGAVEEFVPRGVIGRLAAGNRIATVAGAAAMGFIFPVCECAIVPVVRRLLKKGVPLPAGIAFMLAAPIVNPVTIWSTAVAYQGRWPVVLARVLLGYGIACAAAIIAGTVFSAGKGLRPDMLHAAEPHCCGHDHSPHEKKGALPSRAVSALRHARDDFFDVAPYLVIGTLIAAVIRSSLPVSAVERLADKPLLSIGGMMGLAFALNLCSEADAFIAASFSGLVPLAAQMAFMVLGPMLDIKLLLMYRPVFRGKFILVLAGTVAVLVFACMLIFGYMAGAAGS